MKILTVLICCFSILSTSMFAIENVEEVFVKVDGAEIFCKVLGKGDPIIIVHGGPGLMHDYLYPGLSKLAETNLLVFYDQRGTGRSTGEINKETMTGDVFVKDLDAIRSAFNFEKVTFLGHSFGSALAVNYTMLYPESVERLILINSAPLSTDGFVMYGLRVAVAESPYRNGLQTIRRSPEFAAGDPSAIKEYLTLSAKVSCYDKEQSYDFQVPTTLESFENYRKVFNFFSSHVLALNFNWYSSLQEFQCPVLILYGEADTIPEEVPQKTYENLPNSYLVEVKESGHYIPMEQPEEMLKYIRNFLFE